MTVHTVGIVGAGVMGAGLAQNLAQTGYAVTLTDLSDEILDRAREEIRRNVRFHGMFDKSRRRADPDETLRSICFSTDLARLAGADFVIENVTEKWEVKRSLYAELDAVCAPQVVFAANTSAIPITRIASATRRAPQVIGMHFMNPVPLKPLVEVIRGRHTSDETLETAAALLARMGKQFVVVKDSPGFVSNRVLMLTINEAVFLVHEQVASPEDVDRIFTGCFGHKMGPLATADLIGLDTILFSIEVLYESFNDDKYRPCPLLRRMVDAGLLGRKSGRGFYTYEAAA
jgi:3-hydroxybutyryl-CoA dehydrogenase